MECLQCLSACLQRYYSILIDMKAFRQDFQGRASMEGAQFGMRPDTGS